MPYEITSDQDVASMFIIPVTKEEETEGASEESPIQSKQQEGENNMQPNDIFNSSDLLAVTRNVVRTGRQHSDCKDQAKTDGEKSDGTVKKSQDKQITEVANGSSQSVQTANLVNLIMEKSRKQLSLNKSTTSLSIDQSSGLKIVGVAKPTVTVVTNAKNRGNPAMPHL